MSLSQEFIVCELRHVVRIRHVSGVCSWPYLATFWPLGTAEKEIKKFPVVCICTLHHGGSKVHSSVISESSAKPSSRNVHTAIAALHTTVASLLVPMCPPTHSPLQNYTWRCRPPPTSQFYHILFRLIDASEWWSYQETETISFLNFASVFCRRHLLQRRVERPRYS